jgi:DNA-binding transcriptional MerR regulator
MATSPARPPATTPATARTTANRDTDLTVDQLARLAGTTTRNVRAFQTLGVLPRPVLRGRTGLYGREHLDRLKAILRLQKAGFSLGAVGALFAAWEEGKTLEQVLGVPGSKAPEERRPPDGRPDEPDDGPDDGPPDDLAAFDDWPALRVVGGLAVVPTTVLDQVAS